MRTKQLTCRVHQGKFSYPVKPGRTPTRCANDNACDKHPAMTASQAVARTRRGAAPPRQAEKPAQSRRTRVKKVEEAPTPRKPRPTLRGINRAALNTGTQCSCPEMDGEQHEKGIEGCKYATRKSPAVVKHNPSVPLAFEAKKLLEPEGWKVTARPYFDDDNMGCVVFTGNRGKEIITLTWVNGKLTNQDYSMFLSDNPSLEGMPKPKLDFIVDDMSDAALIQRLSGTKITWWNRTGRSKETAVMPSRADQRIKVEHLMNGSGTEEKRVISFVDQNGTGFRAFDAKALLRVQ